MRERVLTWNDLKGKQRHRGYERERHRSPYSISPPGSPHESTGSTNGSGSTTWSFRKGEDDTLDGDNKKTAEDYEKLLQKYQQEEQARKIAPPPSSSRPRLTFGVEIEFCLAYLVPSGIIYRNGGRAQRGLPHTTNPDPEDGRIVEGIASIEPDAAVLEQLEGLEKFTYTAKLDTQRQKEAFQHIIKTLAEYGIACRDRYPNNRADPNADPFAWTLTGDGSVDDPTTETAANYNFCDVEIASPPLYNHPDSHAEVRRVLDILTYTYRINCDTNETCGLHVHVSSDWNPNPDPLLPVKRSPGFHPRNLANLMATLWVFESVLEIIHPKHRRKYATWSAFCEPLCVSSQLAIEYDSATNTKWKRDGLKRLLSLREEQDCKEICKLCEPQVERLAYNTENLRLLYQTTQDRNRRTIEFRGAQASVLSEEVYNWAKVCTGLVEFADTVDEKILDTFLTVHLDDKPADFSVFELLCAIGRPEQAEYYDEKIRERDQEGGDEDSTPSYEPEDFWGLPDVDEDEF
ncbi:hypothetical protein HYFRA_00012910 [Hymenoscyphus fraxineus]|uniref:Amidoligase enzyme n=1 Tax=Hymenoscyphus fraxineus TaxID=746836 RepID=A0A9N9PXI5_9HELO|nr:hypothetical protein HYFRA_00012910 [Hymenoscyphus fraxineus]